MYEQRSVPPLIGQRTAAWLIFGVITLVLAGGGFGVAAWILDRLVLSAEPAPTTASYTNYSISGDYTSSPEWAVAQQAYQSWVAQNPQPQNVQVLKGLSTQQIYAYMVTQVSGGLKVSCQYCHNINANNNNFADYNNVNKVKAQGMMKMAADLNQNYVAQLPLSAGGRQISCATCHNGKAAGVAVYPADQSPLPDDYRLPLDTYAPGAYHITGEKDPDLNKAKVNQQVMYHMNASLGVGCTFCHNARYFPDNTNPNKTYATVMMLMSKHLTEGTVDINAPGADVPTLLNTQGTTVPYLTIMNNKAPGCWTCHQGAYLPPGSARANPEGGVPNAWSVYPQQ